MALLKQVRGRMAQLAKEMGMTRSAIHQWDRVPAERVVEVERITGIPREKLRPDLFAGRSGSTDQGSVEPVACEAA